MAATSGRVAIRLDDLPVGAATSVEAEGRRITVVRCGPEEVRAVDGDCTHASGPIGQGAVAGCLVACPWHGAVFDARTGEVHRGPARKPLATYPVHIDEGCVVVVLSAERQAVGAGLEAHRG